MFWNCKNLTSLDLSNFNTENVTTMNDMFSGCKNLTSLNLSNFNTENVTYMEYMFYGCKNLTDVTLQDGNAIWNRNAFQAGVRKRIISNAGDTIWKNDIC